MSQEHPVHERLRDLEGQVVERQRGEGGEKKQRLLAPGCAQDKTEEVAPQAAGRQLIRGGAEFADEYFQLGHVFKSRVRDLFAIDAHQYPGAASI